MPMAAAYGLKPLSIPINIAISVLGTAERVEQILSCWLAPLDIDDKAHLCVSLDAEWNISRRQGVSVLQLACHTDPEHIYIIPVSVFSILLSQLMTV
jgi:hypothetical protein